MNSMRKRFTKMQATFVTLGILVTIQMLILYFIQGSDRQRLAIANKTVKDYLVLTQNQNTLYGKIHDFIQNTNKQKLEDINVEIQQVKKALNDWSAKAVDNGFISTGTGENQQRRLKNLQKAVSLVWTKKTPAALEILYLEKKVFFSGVVPITSVIDEIIIESQTSGLFFRNFFMATLTLNIPVFFILLFVTKNLQINIGKDVNILVKLTRAVKNGKMNEELGEAALEETVVLRDAFIEMEQELRNRNMLSRQEVSQTKESNVELEQKMEKSQHVVEQTSSLLSRKNEELEQILYAASHDLRTPLIGVQGFSQELQYLCEMLNTEIEKAAIKPEDKSRLAEILKKDIPNAVKFIIKGSNKMDTMIQGLLRISRVGLENLDIEEVDMDDLFRQIVDVVSFQAQNANAMILPQHVDKCFGDKDKLEQVFTNLIVNSIKYRSLDRNCEIKIFSEKDEKHIKYIVEDNGLGISVENQDKIYKTFFRIQESDSDGEGLGLTIAKRIIDLHDGTIDLESKVGEGCRFIVSIPLRGDDE
jgi:signal transduction histidine kinase